MPYDLQDATTEHGFRVAMGLSASSKPPALAASSQPGRDAMVDDEEDVFGHGYGFDDGSEVG